MKSARLSISQEYLRFTIEADGEEMTGELEKTFSAVRKDAEIRMDSLVRMFSSFLSGEEEIPQRVFRRRSDNSHLLFSNRMCEYNFA